MQESRHNESDTHPMNLRSDGRQPYTVGLAH